MPISAEEMRQALAARRLQDDTALQSILDRIIADMTFNALYTGKPEDREDARQIVLAIGRLRGMIAADASLPDELRKAEELARSME